MSGADKLGYLIRALSRTKRKDYENYVVNAIWNRLAMDDVSRSRNSWCCGLTGVGRSWTCIFLRR